MLIDLSHIETLIEQLLLLFILHLEGLLLIVQLLLLALILLLLKLHRFNFLAHFLDFLFFVQTLEAKAIATPLQLC